MRRKQIARGLSRRFRFIESDVLYVVRLLIAFLLIIVGLIGLLFPIVPDWPLILVGIVIFDVRGGIRRRLIKILPKGWRERTHKILFSKVFNNLGE